MTHQPPPLRLGSLLALVAFVGCGEPVRTDRDSGAVFTDRPRQVVDPRRWIECNVGQQRCFGEVHQTCTLAGELTSVVEEDCNQRGQVCVAERSSGA